jgi:hypothetical protein
VITKVVKWPAVGCVPQAGFLAAIEIFSSINRIDSGQTQHPVQLIPGPLSLSSNDHCMELYLHCQSESSCDTRFLHLGLSVKVFHLNFSKVVKLCITAEIFRLDHFQLICCVEMVVHMNNVQWMLQSRVHCCQQ